MLESVGDSPASGKTKTMIQQNRKHFNNDDLREAASPARRGAARRGDGEIKRSIHTRRANSSRLARRASEWARVILRPGIQSQRGRRRKKCPAAGRIFCPVLLPGLVAGWLNEWRCR